MQQDTDQDKIFVNQIDNLNKAVNLALNRAGVLMVETVRELQDKNKNYATRRMSNLTVYKVDKNILTFGSNAKNKGFYYPFVQEFGRDKGKFPNITDLKKWVQKKISLGHMSLNKKLGKNKTKQVNSLAFLVARKIAEKGVKGKFYYQKAFLKGVELFDIELEKGIKKVFE